MNGKAAGPPTRTYAVLAGVAALLYLLQAFRYYGYLLDDTFISLRYARNLVEGHGLVFNVGERVEGYTNFLYVLIAAAATALGLDPLVATTSVMIASAAGLLAMMATTERLLDRLDGRPAAFPLSPFLVLPLPAFAYWSVVSLEMMLFSMLLSAAVLLSLREWQAGAVRGSAAVFVLLSLSRPEGMFCFAVCTGALFLLEWWQRRSLRHLPRHLLNVAFYGVTFGAYFLWRFRTFGHLFPNTFYARVTGGVEQWQTGLVYLEEVFRAYPLLLLALPASIAAALFARPRRPEPLFVSALALSFLAYTVGVGGDAMPHYRFFLPVLPLCALMLARTLRAVPAADPSRSRYRGAVLTAVLLGGFTFGASTDAPYRAFVAHRTTIVGRHVGEHFRKTLAPNDLIAVNTAGAVPYDSGLPALDMLGLTDENIAHRPVFIVSTGWAAHRRGWGAYVLDRRPRAILWYNSAGSREPHYLSDHELADDPFFRFFYEPHFVSLPGESAGKAGEDGGGRPIARFLGLPFGLPSGPGASAPDLGIRFRAIERPVPLTTVFEAAIALNYFEFARRYENLWLLRDTFRGRPGDFVDEVARRWRLEETAAAGFDPAARAEVEAMCAEAQRLIMNGEHAAARRLLTEAAARNDAARSPLVYHYIANLGVITGDLLVAVGAQREALRLDPDNALYSANLKRLLTMPFEKAIAYGQASTLRGAPLERTPEVPSPQALPARIR